LLNLDFWKKRLKEIKTPEKLNHSGHPLDKRNKLTKLKIPPLHYTCGAWVEEPFYITS
jgi:hypothetical protein